jgi:hypothetical protein
VEELIAQIEDAAIRNKLMTAWGKAKQSLSEQLSEARSAESSAKREAQTAKSRSTKWESEVKNLREAGGSVDEQVTRAQAERDEARTQAEGWKTQLSRQRLRTAIRDGFLSRGVSLTAEEGAAVPMTDAMALFQVPEGASVDDSGVLTGVEDSSFDDFLSARPHLKTPAAATGSPGPGNIGSPRPAGGEGSGTKEQSVYEATRLDFVNRGRKRRGLKAVGEE